MMPFVLFGRSRAAIAMHRLLSAEFKEDLR
jgi:hypothetical protein